MWNDYVLHIYNVHVKLFHKLWDWARRNSKLITMTSDEERAVERILVNQVGERFDSNLPLLHYCERSHSVFFHRFSNLGFMLDLCWIYAGSILHVYLNPTFHCKEARRQAGKTLVPKERVLTLKKLNAHQKCLGFVPLNHLTRKDAFNGYQESVYRRNIVSRIKNKGKISRPIVPNRGLNKQVGVFNISSCLVLWVWEDCPIEGCFWSA